MELYIAKALGSDAKKIIKVHLFDEKKKITDGGIAKAYPDGVVKFVTGIRV